MVNRNRRQALRGAEVLTFDLIFEVLTSLQLEGLLTAPLERAAATGERNLAQRLVGAGAGIGDALHEAIRAGHGEIVSDLMKRGASLTATDAHGHTPLHVAAYKGERDLAQRLMEAGVWIGYALHEAIRGGHKEIVSDLVESGASLAAKDGDGHTPLHVAAIQGETEVVQLLLLKGADKDAFDNKKWTPLYNAVIHENSATALVLLTAGADVNLLCGPLKTPLIHRVAENGNIETLKPVIERGADVNAVDASGRNTALHLASTSDKPEAIVALLEAGANIEARNRLGYTPLHRASLSLSHEAVLCLLEHGATVNVQNDILRTPLINSALKAGTQGAAEVVDALLRAGADETIVDNQGRKACDMIGLVEEQVGRLAEDVESVRELLANAPADRAWRRRGYLVLCRAHPGRVHQSQVISSTHHADNAQAEESGDHETVGGGNVDEVDGGDWAVVVAKVLRLQEEGIFRTIVGYL